jgi:hypothetical protein
MVLDRERLANIVASDSRCWADRPVQSIVHGMRVSTIFSGVYSWVRRRSGAEMPRSGDSGRKWRFFREYGSSLEKHCEQDPHRRSA